MKNILHSAILTTIIFALLFVVNSLPINSDFLDPLQQAFKDFELTDIVYSQLLDEAPKRIDTNIVLVNIGALSRREIAVVIDRVMSVKPKIASLDAMFLRETDADETMELVRCINRYDNFVLAEQLLTGIDQEISVLSGLSHDSLMPKEYGFVNFPSAVGSFRTVRSVTPFEHIDGKEHVAFAIKIAERISREDVNYLKSRQASVETINYQKLNSFVRVDFPQVLDTNISIDFIAGKIVLFGYLGERLNDINSYEDRYFTPVNKRYAGKSFPDMFGVEIHANILSMVLHRDYVNSMSFGVNIFLSWVFCFAVLYMFTVIDDKFPNYYDLISKTLQILTIMFLLFMVIISFDYFRYRFDSALAALAIALAADGYQIYASALSARNYSKNSKRPIVLNKGIDTSISLTKVQSSRKGRKKKR
ncbi:MAG: CHASE2 domain-containing protein [Ignavibacteria bacterium]|nr:CHASE2 domain-containing protein [Ignavibacteria bacterium]